MRKSALATAVVVAVVAIGSCAKYKFGELGKMEWVVLPITYDESGRTCRLVGDRPADLRSESNGRLTWIVDGSCPGFNISIIPSDRLSGSRPGAVPAEDGQKITYQMPDNVPKGHYRYLVRIAPAVPEPPAPAPGGEDATIDRDRTAGSLFACPRWPCGGFREY